MFYEGDQPKTVFRELLPGYFKMSKKVLPPAFVHKMFFGLRYYFGSMYSGSLKKYILECVL